MRQTLSIFLSSMLLSGIAAAEPAITTAAPEAFDLTMKQGRDAIAAGLFAEAERLFQQACPAAAMPSFSPSKAAACYHHLGVAAMKGSRVELAPDIFRKASDAWQAAGPEYAETWGYTQMILGDLYQQQRQPGKSEEVVNRYVEYLRKNGKEKTEQYAQALSRLALTYADTGRTNLAQTTILESIAAFGMLPAPHNTELAYARNTLGLIDLSMGLQNEAESNLRVAVRIASAELGEMNIDTAGYQTNLALALLSKGDVDSAEALLKRARSVVERIPAAPGNQLGMISAELSAIAIMRNKPGIANDEARKALDILSREKFPDEKAIALAQVNLADVHFHANRLAEAEKLLDSAIQMERKAAPESRLLADGIRRLARLRAARQRWKESQELYREAIGIYEVRVGAQNPAIVPLLREYAETLKRDGGSKAEIRGVETRAKSILTFRAAGFTPTR